MYCYLILSSVVGTGITLIILHSDFVTGRLEKLKNISFARCKFVIDPFRLNLKSFTTFSQDVRSFLDSGFNSKERNQYFHNKEGEVVARLFQLT